jgi:hypothetical protein
MSIRWFDNKIVCGAVWAAMLAIAVVGCGSSDRGSVSGVITRKDGTPLPSAQVIARSDSGKAASGTSDAQGHYSLAARDATDGIPTGDYTVIIAEDLGGMASFRKPTIDGKYANASTSGLKFSVKPAEKVTFDIKVDPPGTGG